MNHSFCDWGSACFFVCSVLFIESEGNAWDWMTAVFFFFFFFLIFMYFDCCGFVPPCIVLCFDVLTKSHINASASVCDHTCWTAHISFMKVWIQGRVYIYGCSCNTLKYVYIPNKVVKYLSKLSKTKAFNDWKCEVNLFNICTFVYASLTKASCRTRLHSPCRLE